MNRLLAVSILTVVWLFALSACASRQPPRPAMLPCSPLWFEAVEEQLPTGDSLGHGPDVGSLEWRSVIEFKLGVRGQPAVPPRDTELWCRYIDKKLRERG